MRGLIHRYRSYLSLKAAALEPGAPRLVEMQWQILPWLSPLVLALVIDWIFDLSGPQSLWVAAPLIGTGMIGAAFVGRVFVVAGVKEDVS